jgi:chromate reductase, NAD(P)H dehydrogenase (quinone)
MRLLAISGSLRAASSNTALVRAVAALSTGSVEVDVYEGLAEVPPFNPDVDDAEAPPAVAAFRRRLDRADAVLISSPEYAHGVSGVLKNALDWIVGSGELIDKPIGLVNASPRAVHAHAALSETLRVMSGRLIAGGSIAIAVPKGARAEDLAADVHVSARLRAVVSALADATADGQRAP